MRARAGGERNDTPAEIIDEEALLTPDIVTQFGQPPYRIDLLNAIDGVTFAEVWKGAVAVAVGRHQLRHLPVADKEARIPTTRLC